MTYSNNFRTMVIVSCVQLQKRGLPTRCIGLFCKMEYVAGGDTWREKVRACHREGEEWYRWQRLVCHPETPASELQVIADTFLKPKPSYLPRPEPRISGSGVCVLEAIAAHPNASPFLIAEIIGAVPATAHAFCCNPVASLLLLELPDFTQRLSGEAQLALLCEQDIPRAFVPLIEKTAKRPEVRKAARLHRTLASDVTPGEDWQAEVRSHWKSVCTQATRLKRAWQCDLVELGLAPPWVSGGLFPLPSPPARYPLLDEWFCFAHKPQSPEETALLRKIGLTAKNELAQGLRASGTPADLIRLVQTEKSHRGLVMQAVFRHPNANGEVIAALASVPDAIAPRDLAQHKQAGPRVLGDLLQHDEPQVRRLARRHPNAPPDAHDLSLRALAWQVESDKIPDNLPFVSFALSLHFGTKRPVEAIVRRAESLSWTERLEAVLIATARPDALNGDFAGRTSRDLLEHLAGDGNRLVRAAARTGLADPEYRFVL